MRQSATQVRDAIGAWMAEIEFDLSQHNLLKTGIWNNGKTHTRAHPTATRRCVGLFNRIGKEPMLFDTFVTTVWKPSCAKLRECTKVGYESALNCHILPQWGGRDMDAISVADIESWLDSFDRPGAARKAYAVFRAILRLAFKRGLTDNDVTRREIRLPHLRHYEPQVLSTAGELDVAVDRDDATDATQSEDVVRIRRLPLLGYGKLSSWDRIAERADAILIAANVSHVRHSDSSISSGREASRRLPI